MGLYIVNFFHFLYYSQTVDTYCTLQLVFTGIVVGEAGSKSESLSGHRNGGEHIWNSLIPIFNPRLCCNRFGSIFLGIGGSL